MERIANQSDFWAVLMTLTFDGTQFRKIVNFHNMKTAMRTNEPKFVLEKSRQHSVTL